MVRRGSMKMYLSAIDIFFCHGMFSQRTNRQLYPMLIQVRFAVFSLIRTVQRDKSLWAQEKSR